MNNQAQNTLIHVKYYVTSYQDNHMKAPSKHAFIFTK